MGFCGSTVVISVPAVLRFPIPALAALVMPSGFALKPLKSREFEKPQFGGK